MLMLRSGKNEGIYLREYAQTVDKLHTAKNLKLEEKTKIRIKHLYKWRYDTHILLQNKN